MKLEITAPDIIAGLLIIAGTIMLIAGRDGTATLILLSITAFYFGLRTTIAKKP